MSARTSWTRSSLRSLAAAAALLAAGREGMAHGQAAGPDLVSARSRSGQFMVYAQRAPSHPPAILQLATNQSFVQLEPMLATVSCERIKQIVLRELGVTAPWHGTVHLVLYPARAAGDGITVIAERFRNGWQYEVNCPDVVARSRYVRVMVRVLLLDLANRSREVRSAEIPPWLTEGLAQLLLADNEIEIILPPPRGSANRVSVSATVVNARKESLREQAQKKLGGRPPLSFEELSWPGPEALSDEPSDLYAGSAQLFVGELLRLPDGRACLRAMLGQLPQHYNWQFAFLQAFQGHFGRPLDVEKWWALAVAHAMGRSPGQTWTLGESWQKLDRAIHCAVQVRTGTNELPLHAEVTLQTVIREWEPVRQNQALGNALRELGLLRLRIAQEFVGLVQDYSQTLDGYLRQRDRSRSVLPFVRRASRRRAAEEAVQQLDGLDARREALWPASKPPGATPGPGPPAL